MTRTISRRGGADGTNRKGQLVREEQTLGPSGAQRRSSALGAGVDASLKWRRWGERREWVEDSGVFPWRRKKTGRLEFDLIPGQVETMLLLMGLEGRKGGCGGRRLGTPSQDSHSLRLPGTALVQDPLP